MTVIARLHTALTTLGLTEADAVLDSAPFRGACFSREAVLTAVTICRVMHRFANARKTPAPSR
ncbi:MAG: hypothetical protein K6W08_04465 [Firmicutes bacterium]|nr:hypothetical protein [Bacillota bacterium]